MHHKHRLQKFPYLIFLITMLFSSAIFAQNEDLDTLLNLSLEELLNLTVSSASGVE